MQFERIGYFCVDPDSRPGALVFNRTDAQTYSSSISMSTGSFHHCTDNCASRILSYKLESNHFSC